MSEVIRLTPAQVRPLRRGAPSAHVLDEHGGSVHLGLLVDGELVGVLSAFTESPPVAPGRRDLQLYGPFGDGGDRLIDAMVERVGPGARLWADSARPTLEARGDGIWVRSTGELPPPQPGQYSARDIVVLEGLEAVRRRPAMYIGSTGPEGVAHLAWVLVRNAIDGHRLGGLSNLVVCSDGIGVSVTDDGPGLPPDSVTRLCTTLFGGYGVGLPLVTALTSTLVVTTHRDGRRWQQAFHRGRPHGDVQDLGPTTRAGTSFWFTPDPAIFPDPTPDLASLREQFVALAHLNPALRFTVGGEALDGGEGLLTLAERLAGAEVVRKLVAQGEHGGIRVNVAVAWGSGPAVTRGWSNERACRGSHVDGLEAVLGAEEPGRVALVAVELDRPQYAGRWEVLQVAAAREAVEAVVRAAL